MAYDATETLRSLERPELTVPREQLHLFRTVGRLAVWVRRQLNRFPGVDLEVETKTYTGRLLSHQEWVPLQRRMQEVVERAEAGSEADQTIPSASHEEEVREVYRDYLLQVGIPPSHVFRLPPRAMKEAMEDFFACQRRAAATTARPAGASGRTTSRKRERVQRR